MRVYYCVYFWTTLHNIAMKTPFTRRRTGARKTPLFIADPNSGHHVRRKLVISRGGRRDQHGPVHTHRKIARCALIEPRPVHLLTGGHHRSADNVDLFQDLHQTFLDLPAQSCQTGP